MQRILTYWSENRLMKFSAEEMLAAEAAALLHDIGHGPFSHALEHSFSQVDHEKLGRAIVSQRLAPIFEKHGLDVESVTAIMAGTYPQPVFHELLSSQLDVDRMDYLQRDSLYTGAKYGLFDIDRIVYTIRPIPNHEGQFCCAVDPKGCEAVEGYLFCRYFMHWQVYLHKTVRSYETLLRVILKRAHWLQKNSPGLLELPRTLSFLFAGDNPDIKTETKPPKEAAAPVPAGKADKNTGDVDPDFLNSYLTIDDFDFYHTLKLWSQSPDPVLSDLSYRFLNRKPFKAFDDPGEGPILERIRHEVQKTIGDNWEWYFHTDTPQNLGYDIYHPGRSSSPIRILSYPLPSWKEISQASRTRAVEALSEQVQRPLVMIPSQCFKRVRKWLEQDRPYQSTMF